jgi:LysM repeat protein
MYTVQPGDTLGGIARRHGLTLAALLALNPGIADPDRIVVGQRLKLPEDDSIWSAWMLPDPPRLSDSDWEDAAREFKIERAALEAVAEVEAPSDGFLPDGRPRILFEAHVFSRLTGRVYDLRHTDISSPRWNKALYKGGAAEYARLEKAMRLDLLALPGERIHPETRTMALQSASWGRFQAMGFNYKHCGFGNVESMVRAMFSGERAHLKAFLVFITTIGLTRALREKKWEEFAREYNGPAWRDNNYAGKLDKAYRRACFRLSERKS